MNMWTHLHCDKRFANLHLNLIVHPCYHQQTETERLWYSEYYL